MLLMKCNSKWKNKNGLVVWFITAFLEFICKLRGNDLGFFFDAGTPILLLIIVITGQVRIELCVVLLL